MKLILTDEQQAPLKVAFRTASNNLAKIDGIPEWASSNPDVAEIITTDDPNAVIVRSKGLGVAQISVTGDADLGSGQRPVTGVLDVEVQAAEAVSAGIEAGTAEPKPTE